mgnify:CR=1 FL=1
MAKILPNGVVESEYENNNHLSMSYVIDSSKYGDRSFKPSQSSSRRVSKPTPSIYNSNMPEVGTRYGSHVFKPLLVNQSVAVTEKHQWGSKEWGSTFSGLSKSLKSKDQAQDDIFYIAHKLNSQRILMEKTLSVASNT